VLGACDGADDPVAPAAEPLAGEQEAAAPEYTLAAGTTQRIVFTSTRKGGYDVFKMDPQGSNLVPLATSTDFEFSPAWSWDNKRIALVRKVRPPGPPGRRGACCVWTSRGNGQAAETFRSSGHVPTHRAITRRKLVVRFVVKQRHRTTSSRSHGPGLSDGWCATEREIRRVEIQVISR